MFTGIIEELGRVKDIKENKNILSFDISAKKVLSDIQVGHSIAVNGVCLTVTNILNDCFSIDIVEETLNKSNLGELKKNSFVNLERAMKVSDRFNGHLVQGHVETLGVVLDKSVDSETCILSVGLEPEWMRYCIPKGSITLDGISLTIASINGNIIDIAIIPHTLENTTIGMKGKSDTLNIETDMVGKYIDRLLTFDGDDVEIDHNILKAIRHIQYGES